MTVPDEAVKAAAKAIWEARPMERDYEEGSPNYGGAKPWEDIKQYQRERCMKIARAALTAAAPFIAAQTLNEAATDWTEHQRANMGKGTVQQISTWLRDRAASHRSEQ
jgi:hypothetical protein